MKKRYRILPLLMAAAMAMTACSKTDETEATKDAASTAAIIPVEVEEAVPAKITKTLTYVGKVSAVDSVDVTSKLSGQVKEVYADVGDTVKKGQVLFLIDDKDIKDQIKTTQAQLNVANAGVNSAQTALKQVQNGGQTQTQRLTLENAQKNAQTGVDNAKVSMENAETSVNTAEISLSTARSAFENAQQKYNDYQTMLAAGVITQNDFNAIELAYTQSKNAYEQAQNAYNQAVNAAAQTKLAYEQAQNGLAQAKENLELFNGKTVNDSKETAENAVKTAQATRGTAAASLSVLQSNLNYIQVTSPIDGVIVSRDIEPTNMVSAASKPFVVADTSKVTVDVQVSEKIINLINVGQEIDVNINAVYSDPVKGRIKTIDPAAGNGGAFTVKIEIDNSDGKLKPGMVAHVSFVEQEADDVVVVPRNTVIEDNNTFYVYVVENGTKAVKKEVTTGIDDGAEIEIHGIEFGEQIVVSGQSYLSDGSPVSISEDEEETTTEEPKNTEK